MSERELRFVDLNANGAFALGLRAAGFACTLAQSPTDGQAADWLENNLPGYAGLGEKLDRVLLPGVLRYGHGKWRTSSFRQADRPASEDIRSLITATSDLVELVGCRSSAALAVRRRMREAQIIVGIEDRAEELPLPDSRLSSARLPFVKLADRPNFAFAVYALADRSVKLRKLPDSPRLCRASDALLEGLARSNYVALLATLRSSDFGTACAAEKTFVFAVRRTVFAEAQKAFSEKDHAIWSTALRALSLVKAGGRFEGTREPVEITPETAAGTLFEPLFRKPASFREAVSARTEFVRTGSTAHRKQEAGAADSPCGEPSPGGMTPLVSALSCFAPAKPDIEVRREGILRVTDTPEWACTLTGKFTSAVTTNAASSPTLPAAKLTVTGDPNAALSSSMTAQLSDAVSLTSLSDETGTLTLSDEEAGGLLCAGPSFFESVVDAFFSSGIPEKKPVRPKVPGGILCERVVNAWQADRNTENPAESFSVDGTGAEAPESYEERLAEALAFAQGREPQEASAERSNRLRLENVGRMLDEAEPFAVDGEEGFGLEVITDTALRKWLVSRVLGILSSEVRCHTVRGFPAYDSVNGHREWAVKEGKGRRQIRKLLTVLLSSDLTAVAADPELRSFAVVRHSKRLEAEAKRFLDATADSGTLSAYLSEVDLGTRLHFVNEDAPIADLPCSVNRLWYDNRPVPVAFRDLLLAQGFPAGFITHGTNFRPGRTGAERRYLRIEEAAWTVSPVTACAFGDLIKTFLRLAARSVAESTKDKKNE